MSHTPTSGRNNSICSSSCSMRRASLLLYSVTPYSCQSQSLASASQSGLQKDGQSACKRFVSEHPAFKQRWISLGDRDALALHLSLIVPACQGYKTATLTKLNPKKSYLNARCKNLLGHVDFHKKRQFRLCVGGFSPHFQQGVFLPSRLTFQLPSDSRALDLDQFGFGQKVQQWRHPSPSNLQTSSNMLNYSMFDRKVHKLILNLGTLEVKGNFPTLEVKSSNGFLGHQEYIGVFVRLQKCSTCALSTSCFRVGVFRVQPWVETFLHHSCARKARCGAAWIMSHLKAHSNQSR